MRVLSGILPEAQDIWKVRLELTIHDGPIAIRRQPIECDPHHLPRRASRTIRSNQILCTNGFRFPRMNVAQCSQNRPITCIWALSG